MGAFPILDDKSSDKNTDAKYVAGCEQEVRQEEGHQQEGQGQGDRAASEYYYGDKKKDYLFTIVHYAGDVLYDAREFLAKNKDKLPPQLLELASRTRRSSSRSYQLQGGRRQEEEGQDVQDARVQVPLKQLKSLADTLTATTPHYVRCVKPNDIHYRPVDGNGRSTRGRPTGSLLYAGVMEVCKIKKVRAGAARPALAHQAATAARAIRVNPCIKLQAMARSMGHCATYVQRRKEQAARELIRAAWRPYNAWQLWKGVGYKLGGSRSCSRRRRRSRNTGGGSTPTRSGTKRTCRSCTPARRSSWATSRRPRWTR